MRRGAAEIRAPEAARQRRIWFDRAWLFAVIRFGIELPLFFRWKATTYLNDPALHSPIVVAVVPGPMIANWAGCLKPLETRLFSPDGLWHDTGGLLLRPGTVGGLPHLITPFG